MGQDERSSLRRALTAAGTGAAVAGGAAAVTGVQRLREVRAVRAAARVAEPHDHGVTAQDVRLRSRADSELHGWWVPAASTTAPAVLVLHGYASHAGDLLPAAPLLHGADLHVLLLSVRGHGRSEPVDHTPRPPEFAEDVRTALDWLEAHEQVTTIGMLGHSMGGSVGLVTASYDPRVQAVVSVSGVASPTLSRIGWWPAALSRTMLRAATRNNATDPSTRFAVNRIAHVDGAVLLIHGTADQVVPVRHAHALAAARPDAELVLVEGAGHSRFDAFAPAMDRALTFLDTHLGDG